MLDTATEASGRDLTGTDDQLSTTSTVPEHTTATGTPSDGQENHGAQELRRIPGFIATDCRGCSARAENERQLRSFDGYRSPKRAFLYSLLLPGLGQAYNRNYLRTAAYAGAEIILATASISLSSKGKKKAREAEEFADRHFSQEKFRQYYRDVASFLETNRYTAEDIEGIRRKIVFDSSDFASSADHKDNNYYSVIDRASMVHGWDDAEATFSSSGFVYSDDSYDYAYQPYDEWSIWFSSAGILLLWQLEKGSGDTLGGPLWGYSQNQNRYHDMVLDAGRYHRIAMQIIPFIAINHFVSGLDALISAMAWNRRLTGERSFLDRIRFDHQLAVTPGGITTQLGIRVGL